MQKYVNLIAFLKKLISKEHVVVVMESPDWVQVKKTKICSFWSCGFLAPCSSEHT